MSLIKYRADAALPAFGLRNSGAICYFNSMLQCFLSCTSVLDTFDATPDLRTRNQLCSAVWALIASSRAGEDVTHMSIVVWQALQRQMAARGIRQFGGGMEDTHEGFVKFLDAFNAPELHQLFEHRYKTTFKCAACTATWAVETDSGERRPDMGVFCKLQQGDDIQTVLQRTEMAEQVTCHNCHVRATHLRTDRMAFAPEIIVVLFAKYGYSQEKKRVEYIRWTATAPAQLSIPGRNEKIEYRLIATNEHSGDTEGGHYWALAQRGRAYNFNDMTVTPIDQVSSGPTTYIAWYHVV